MSCSEEQLKTYSDQWMDLMPTFVAPNVEYDDLHDDHYAPYNKPYAVMRWLQVLLSQNAAHYLTWRGTCAYMQL